MWCILLILVNLFSCATSEIVTQDNPSQIQDPNLVWPPPPQIARIQYIRSITGKSDITIKKSWFKKTVDSIFGKDETSGILLRPYGVFADKERIYVTDTGTHCLHIFDMKERKYLEIKKVDKKDLISPIGVVADKDGEIYLSDSILKRVFILDKEGKYLKEIGAGDLFIRPTGIAVDEERLYVVDTHAHKILVLSKKDGSFLFSFGKNGTGKEEFNYPTNIFVDKNGLLYITDSMNFRIQIFNKNGYHIFTFGKYGDGSGDFSKPKGVAVDSDGNIYVADALFDTVQIFNREGQLLLAFGNTGRGIGQMVLPAGLFIDEEDRIYVADSANRRIQIFRYLKSKI